MKYKVIKLENGRFFNSYKKGRLCTAWSLPGAKMFDNSDYQATFFNFALSLLAVRGIRFSIVYISLDQIG